jgi:hypothetical protein
VTDLAWNTLEYYFSHSSELWAFAVIYVCVVMLLKIKHALFIGVYQLIHVGSSLVFIRLYVQILWEGVEGGSLLWEGVEGGSHL